MSGPVDIVIPIRSTRRFPVESYLRACVDTLYRTTQNYRLVLVDDASDDEGRVLIDQIARERRDTLLIRSNYQRWFTRAVNLGLRMARQEWTVVLNTDTELGPGWLEEMLACRDEFTQVTGKRVGLVGSILSAEEGRRWAESVNPDYVTGHCWLVNVHALFEVSAARGTPGIYLNELDQKQIHIQSDVYLCWDLNARGWATIKSFKAAVGHHGGKSWGHQLSDCMGTQLSAVSDSYA